MSTPPKIAIFMDRFLTALLLILGSVDVAVALVKISNEDYGGSVFNISSAAICFILALWRI